MKESAAQPESRPLLRNALSLYAIQGLNYLIPLVQIPYLLRALGPGAYGAIIFSQALVGYAVVLTDYGFNLTAARDISIIREDATAVAKIYWTTMAAKLLLLLVSFALLAVIVLVTPALREAWKVTACAAVMVLGSVAFPQWYFQGLERLGETAAIQGLAKIVTALAVVVLIRSPADLLLAAFLVSAPSLAGVAAALCLGRTVAPSSFYLPTVADIKQSLRTGWHMFVSGASIALYGHTNVFVLGLICGDQAVAVYNVAYKLMYTLQSLASPVTQAVFPRAAMLFSRDPSLAWALLIRVARLLLPAVVAGSLLLAIVSPHLINFFAGPAYLGAVPVVIILCFVPVCVTASMLLAQCVMVNHGLTRPLFRIYVTVGLLNLIALPVLVWKFQAEGAALSLVLAELLGPLLMARAINKAHPAASRQGMSR